MNFNFYENHRLLYGVVLFGFVFLSLLIAVYPALWVGANNHPLPGTKELTEQQQRGMDIYFAEGCSYCHSQQVRPLKEDQVFGRPSAPGDFARLHPIDMWRMTPEVLGTERTGPDLSDIASRQPSDTWQYIHLYNPRAVVKASVMQAFPWFFVTKENPDSTDVIVPVPSGFVSGKGKVVATAKARDVVAYLLSLKQAPVPGSGGTGGSSSASSSSGAAGSNAAMGDQIYNSRCASCHQQNGEGVSGVFPPLKGDPVVTAADPTRHIETVLFGLKGKTIDGVKYSAEMPAHKDLLDDDKIAAVINHERTSWGNHAPTVTPKEVSEIRAKGPAAAEGK